VGWKLSTTDAVKDLEMLSKIKAKQQFRFIGYYASKAEAIQALMDYHSNPYDLDSAKTTLREVYERWSTERFPQISASNRNGIQAAWRICEQAGIDRMSIAEIKLDHLQEAGNQSGKNAPTLKKYKIMLSQLYKYAVIHEIIPADKDKISYLTFSAGNPNKIDRHPYSAREIAALQSAASHDPYAAVIVIMIYTGLRVGEMCDLKKENVNLPERWIDVVQSKTAAGIRRVPISDKIMPLITDWFQRSQCDYLICTPSGEHCDSHHFRATYFVPISNAICSSGHLPHDTRHTCISLLAKAGVDERLIKRIVGHASNSVTDRVYTHLDVEDLREAINRI
jgi:integrase